MSEPSFMTLTPETLTADQKRMAEAPAIPKSARDHAKLLLLDTVGLILPARSNPKSLASGRG